MSDMKTILRDAYLRLRDHDADLTNRIATAISAELPPGRFLRLSTRYALAVLAIEASVDMDEPGWSDK